MDCLFCKIIAGEIPSNKVYEDDLVYAFRDIAPQAPTHILVIPKAHLSGVSDITPENSALVAHIFEVIPAIAKAEGLTVDEDALTNYFSTNVGTSDYSAYQTYYGRGYLCQAVLLDSAMELVTSSAVRA